MAPWCFFRLSEQVMLLSLAGNGVLQLLKSYFQFFRLDDWEGNDADNPQETKFKQGIEEQKVWQFRKNPYSLLLGFFPSCIMLPLLGLNPLYHFLKMYFLVSRWFISSIFLSFGFALEILLNQKQLFHFLKFSSPSLADFYFPQKMELSRCFLICLFFPKYGLNQFTFVLSIV